MRVTSTGRSAAANAAVGGSSTSQHVGGNAFDFVVANKTPEQVAAIIAASDITYGQNIAEYVKGVPHNHLGVGTAMETFGMVNHSKSASLTSQIAQQGVGNARDFLKNYLGDTLGNALSDVGEGAGNALQAPGNAISGWFGEAVARYGKPLAFALLAFIFIAGAILLLGKNEVVSTVKGAVAT